jgi:hypothetical protein
LGPNNLGFDYFFGIPASLDMPPYLYVENQWPQGIPVEITNEGGRTGITAPGFKAKNVMPDLTKMHRVPSATKKMAYLFSLFFHGLRAHYYRYSTTNLREKQSR